MSKRIWAGIGAVSLSVAGIFAVVGQSDEPPPKDEPTPWADYMREFNARLHAQQATPSASPASATIAAPAILPSAVPASVSSVTTSSDIRDGTVLGELKDFALGVRSADKAVVLKAYEQAFRRVTAHHVGTPEQRDAMLTESFGGNLTSLATQLDHLAANRELELTAKLAPYMNPNVALTGLTPDAHCQLVQTVRAMDTALSLRKEVRTREIIAGSPDYIAGLEKRLEEYGGLNTRLMNAKNINCFPQPS